MARIVTNPDDPDRSQTFNGTWSINCDVDDKIEDYLDGMEQLADRPWPGLGEFTIRDRSLTFDVWQVNPDSIDVFAGKAVPSELTVKVRGKRYWWKPWKRRPDKQWYFPSVEIRPGRDA